MSLRTYINQCDSLDTTSTESLRPFQVRDPRQPESSFLSRRSRQSAPIVKKRIFIVEDHPATRQGIVETLNRQANLIVCGEADDVVTALTAIEAAVPDLVLTDIQLKSSDGIELVRKLRRLHPALPVVTMTIFNSVHNEQQARAAGANGFVDKQEGAEKMVQAINDALL